MAKLAPRKYVIQGSFLLAGLIILLNTAKLQVINSDFKDRAEKTTLHKRTIYPSRGIIYDRKGKLMVINEPIYNIEVINNEVSPDIDTTLFCKLLNIDKQTFNKNLKKDWASPRYRKSVPFTFLKRIRPEEFASFQEHLHKFSGFYPEVRNVRAYPHQNAAHILGYLGEVNEKQIEESEREYALGDYIGLTGLEKMYETELRGKKGVEYILKDNLGREVSTLAEGRMDSFAIEGKDIISTIDLQLQQYGEKLMSNKRGSIVAIEPKTGEILTMISTPTYDPNKLRVDKNRGEAFNELLNDSINRPFFDRSVMAKYPPGSIFKPIFALVALQEGITWPYRTIYCNGSYESNTKGFSQGCHNHPTPYNIKVALQHSCNTYFYQIMREFINGKNPMEPEIGMDKLKEYLTHFGIGKKLGVDNLYEHKGFFPDGKFFTDLYRKRGERRWYSTMVLSLGIGQGEIELTTLQMANLAAILANRGEYTTPHLIRSFKNNDLLIPESFNEKHAVPIDSVYFPLVVDGLERVVRDGTATVAYVPGLDIVGKTGTSQNTGKDHSVFFAFAPKDDPKIAIAVYVENAGWGAQYAAPIASLMIEKYLNGELRKRRTYLEKNILDADLITNP